MNNDDPQFLCLIFDTDPTAWSINSNEYIDLNAVLKSIVVFLNAYTMMNRYNLTMIIANTAKEPVVLFPKLLARKDYFRMIGSDVADVIDDIIRLCKEEDVPSNGRYNISNALSLALCAINKQLSTGRALQPRILTFQASYDIPTAYNRFMNAVFSAQKLSVPLDSILLANNASTFLQQASFLTKGLHFHFPLDTKHVVHVLFTYFLASTAARKDMSLPVQATVDFRGTCSCHFETKDTAYMCSVCLTLLCAIPDTCCPTCGSLVQ